MTMEDENKINVPESGSDDGMRIKAPSEDDALREMFAAFQPKMATDLDFMSRLQQRLDSVEYIRCQTAASGRSRKLALGIAVMTGFVAGVALSFLFPYLQGLFSGISASIPTLDPALVSTTVSCIATGSVTVGMTLAAYDIALSLLKR